MEIPACTNEWHSSVFFSVELKFISFSQLALKFLALTLPGIYSLQCANVQSCIGYSLGKENDSMS